VSTARTIAYILGGAFLCAFAATVLTFWVHDTGLELAMWLVAVVGGAYYGFVQSKKQGSHGGRLTEMTVGERGCAAGRTAFFNGAWTQACENRAMYAIASPAAEPMWLCDEHFEEVARTDLVEDPYVGEAEYRPREAQSIDGQPGERRWTWS
jgi:hypothetical protein